MRDNGAVLVPFIAINSHVAAFLVTLRSFINNAKTTATISEDFRKHAINYPKVMRRNISEVSPKVVEDFSHTKQCLMSMCAFQASKVTLLVGF